MRILYVGHTYTVRANQAKIVAMAGLPNVDILLLTPSAWKGPLYHNKAAVLNGVANIEHMTLNCQFVGKESLYLFPLSVVSLIKRFKPDIIHVEQGSYALCYAQLIWAARQVAPEAALSFFTWWNLPTTMGWMKRLLEKYNFEHSAGAVCGNQDAKALLRNRGFEKPIEVIPQLGVELNDYLSPPDPKVRATLGLRRYTIGYVGRISEEKGVLDIPEALSMIDHSAISLLTVGRGPALTQLVDRCRSYGIHHVHIDAIRNEEVPKYLAVLDVLLLMSRTSPEWMEQFGHILIEAMAAGVPVIGSRSGEIPSVIGDAGILVNERDCEALARSISALVENNIMRESLINLGRQRAISRFSHKKVAEMHVNFFEQLLRAKRTHG